MKSKKQCTFEGCSKPVWAKGYCKSHYNKVRRKSLGGCKVKGCKKQAFAKDMCNKHYEQNKQLRSDVCSVSGCKNKAVKVKMCSRHYNQIRRCGKIYRTKFDPNIFEFEGNICYIHLFDHQGNFKCEGIIDAEDYNKVKDFKWTNHSSGYVFRREGKTSIMLHHAILPGHKELDHKNGNGKDNRKTNLRPCTRSQNLQNTKIFKTNKSGIKGVSWDSIRKKWTARITINKQFKHLGRFDVKKDAVKARIEAEDRYFGEFSIRRRET